MPHKTYALQPSFANEVGYLKKNEKTPTEYIIGKFSTYDLVMLGENHAIKEIGIGV